jgi:hypothetical protein
MAEGMASESFLVGEAGLETLDPASRARLFEALPALRGDVSRYGTSARPCLKRHEALALARLRGPLLHRVA